jgi:small subunit ribosomal protein S16
MLAIRMQRTGRKGHAMFRVVVQESRVTPTSGKVVALLGSYDPHAKTTTLDKVKAATFLSNGAQPSDRVVSLFQKEGVKLPEWVTVNTAKAGKLRHADKLRKNQPKEEVKEEAPVAEAAPETPNVEESTT